MRNSIVLYRMSFFVNDIIKSEISKRPISYGEYLRKEKVRDKTGINLDLEIILVE